MGQDGNIVESFSAKVLHVTSEGIRPAWNRCVEEFSLIETWGLRHKELNDLCFRLVIHHCRQLENWDEIQGLEWYSRDAGFGKTPNFLTGYGIQGPLLGSGIQRNLGIVCGVGNGKRYSGWRWQKLGMRDCREKGAGMLPWVPEDIFFLSILMVRGEAAPR